MVGAGADWEIFGETGDQTQRAQGRVTQRRQSFRQACPRAPLPVFVPPAIFDEMELVLDAPMSTAEPQQPLRTNFIARNARDLVMGLGVGRDAFRSDFRVDPEDQLDAIERNRIADVVDLFALDNPEFAAVNFAPFLSVVSASGGRDSAS